MATNAQRWQSLCDALLNRVATVDEQGRLGAAMAHHNADAAEYAAMTTGDKVAYAVTALRRHLLMIVKEAEGEAAAAAARAAAAVDVDTDFS